MKTQDEIVNRILERKDNDFFGWEIECLISYLIFENAKQFLKNDVTEMEWKRETKTPKQVMKDYMPFAWEKANDKRGLSAGRSMCHYKAWLWLDGDEEIYPMLEDYNFYGKPQLIEICNYLGIDPSEYDDGVRENR